MGKGIYEGLRILDFSNNLAGPCGTAMFADQGAEVIKVERPHTGDDTRAFYPLIDGVSLQYMWDNRGKKSIVLNLKDPDAQRILLAMAKDADVIVESFRPGTMKKYGLDYDSICKVNEKIIYCSVSACGQTGGYAQEPGFDLIAQAMSGLMDMSGEEDGPPTKLGTTVGDYIGSMNVFGSISAALFHRLRTGEGQYIDISLLAGFVSCNTSLDISATCGTHPTRIGPHDNTVVPYGAFRGNNDEYAVLVACTFNLFPKFCKLMHKEKWLEDPEYLTASTRINHRAEIISLIEDYLRSFPSMDEAIAALKEAGIPCAKIKSTYEVARDPVLWENGELIEIEGTESMGGFVYKGRGPWIRLSKTPFVYKPAPDLGADNYSILGRYGLSRQQIDELESRW